jgi:catechol-2,3-dioxygenase
MSVINTSMKLRQTTEDRHSQRFECRNTGVHHVGLYASDPVASAAFYCDVLGMQVVGGSGPEHPLGTSAFVCSRPDQESHEIALVADRKHVHFAFKVASLEELRTVHARVLERKLEVKFAFNHGASFAFYFDDPDANMIEVYWPTGALDYKQPYLGPLEPLDLTKSDEELLQQLAHRPA